MPGLFDTQNYLNSQIQQMQGRGDYLMDPYSQSNQYNRQYLASMFGAQQPNYFDIAASQGLGTSSGIAALQQAAARRNAGIQTGTQFGQMMNDNQKTALGYYNAAQQGSEGLLGMQYQDQARQQALEEQKREFDAKNGSIWNDILTTGLGIAGSVLGGPAGGAAGGLLGKWLGGGNKTPVALSVAAQTANYSYALPSSFSYGVMANNQNQPTYPQLPQNNYSSAGSLGGYRIGTSWDPVLQQYR